MALIIKKTWIYKRKKCIILDLKSHYCAYVETKLKDVCYSFSPTGIEDDGSSPESFIVAHGGLNFSGKLSVLIDKKDYFGMDFAHAGDYCDYSKRGIPSSLHAPKADDEHAWTVEEVEIEAEKMADSIIEYEKLYPKLKALGKKFKKEVEEIMQ